MFNALFGADESLRTVIVFALSGLDLSLWFASKPWFSGLAELAASSM